MGALGHKGKGKAVLDVTNKPKVKAVVELIGSSKEGRGICELRGTEPGRLACPHAARSSSAPTGTACATGHSERARKQEREHGVA